MCYITRLLYWSSPEIWSVTLCVKHQNTISERSKMTGVTWTVGKTNRQNQFCGAYRSVVWPKDTKGRSPTHQRAHCISQLRNSIRWWITLRWQCRNSLRLLFISQPQLQCNACARIFEHVNLLPYCQTHSIQCLLKKVALILDILHLDGHTNPSRDWLHKTLIP